MRGFKDSTGKFHPTDRKKFALSSKNIKPQKRNEVTFDLSDNDELIGKKSGDGSGKKIGGLFRKGIEKTSFGVGKSVGIANKELKKHKERKQQEEFGQYLAEKKIDEMIDKILDNNETTNEQKFRFLQRFGVDNNSNLTNHQRSIINKNLKELDEENNQKRSRMMMPSRINTDVVRSSPNISQNAIKLNSGEFITPTKDERMLNLARENLNRSIIPSESQVSTINDRTESEITALNKPQFLISDNTEAEIQGLLGSSKTGR